MKEQHENKQGTTSERPYTNGKPFIQQPNSMPFPMKLHEMLDLAVANNMEHIVSWELEGQAFRVNKPDEFVEWVLPQHFNQTKYKSFQRQLNLYGFERITRGPYKGCYLHKKFVRGQSEMSCAITRKKESDIFEQNSEQYLPSSMIVEPDPINEEVKDKEDGESVESQRLRAKWSRNEAALNTELIYPADRSSNDSIGLSSTKHGVVASQYSFQNISCADIGHFNAVSMENALDRMLDAMLDAVQRDEQESKMIEENYPRRSCSERLNAKDGGKVKPMRVAVFPYKLHDMLDHAEISHVEHIVSWQMQGKAFKIHRPDLFLVTILPQFFSHAKYESFQRQLNLYGFIRIPKGPMKGCYHHPLFIKGGRNLCKQMVRKKAEDIISMGDLDPLIKYSADGIEHQAGEASRLRSSSYSISAAAKLSAIDEAIEKPSKVKPDFIPPNNGQKSFSDFLGNRGLDAKFSEIRMESDNADQKQLFIESSSILKDDGLENAMDKILDWHPSTQEC